MKKRWITGEEILERWQAAPFELLGPVLSGKLVAMDIEYGVRITDEIDECLFCRKFISDNEPTICREILNWPDPSLEKVPIYCHEKSPGMTSEGLHAYKLSFIRNANFYMQEVEAYEQTHGLGPASEKSQEPASEIGEVNECALTPRERQELGRLRLEKEKWDTSIRASIVIGRSLTAGKRFTKKEVWKILTDSGIHGRDLPDSVFNQIWARIPSEFRSTGGRPKTGNAEDF